MNSLSHFLGKYIRSTEDRTAWTHTSLTGGCWNIPDDMLETFYKLYINAVKTTELHIGERCRPNIGPVFIDLDFKFDIKHNTRPRIINSSIICEIVDNFAIIMKNIFGFDHNFECIVTQRPSHYVMKDTIKDGLHIYFPHIRCNYSVHKYLRNEFIKNFNMKNIPDLRTIEEIYDKTTINGHNNWMLYMSTKKNIPAYQIIGFYNSSRKVTDFTAMELVKLLSVRNLDTPYVDLPKLVSEQITQPSDSLIQQNESQSHQTPTSTIPKIISQKSQYDIMIEIVNKHLGTYKQNIQQTYFVTELTNDDILNDESLIKSLLNILDKKRAESYYDWLQIGIILHHCDQQNHNSTINYFNLWTDWSRQSKKFNESYCQKIWTDLKSTPQKPLTINSLLYYAKYDNPEKYTLCINKHRMNIMSKQRNDDSKRNTSYNKYSTISIDI